MPLEYLDPIPEFKDIHELNQYLTCNSCHRCNLGFQPGLNGCCVSRGNKDSKIVLVGEAPGMLEDSNKLPFSGPAGRLLDEIFLSAGINTNTDMYLTNTVLCRPIAAKDSGRQNLTPKDSQIMRCRPFLFQQMKLLQPKLVILCGAVALKAFLPNSKGIVAARGNITIKNNVKYFPIIHPAAILHTVGTPTADSYRNFLIQDAKEIYRLIRELDKASLSEGSILNRDLIFEE